MNKSGRHRDKRTNQLDERRSGQKPVNVAQLVNKGAGLLRMGEPRKALPLLQEAWALDPNEVAVAINLAGAYILLNQHDKAVPVLEAAASLAPENAMIWMNLGAAYLGNPILATADKQAKAIEAFERAAELHPELPNVHYNLGLIYRDQKRWACAQQQFQRAVEVNPEDRDAKKLLEQVRACLSEESKLDDDNDKE